MCLQGAGPGRVPTEGARRVMILQCTAACYLPPASALALKGLHTQAVAAARLNVGDVGKRVDAGTHEVKPLAIQLGDVRVTGGAAGRQLLVLVHPARGIRC